MAAKNRQQQLQTKPLVDNGHKVNGNQAPKEGAENENNALELRPLKDGEILAVSADQQLQQPKPPPPAISVNESR